MLEGKRLEDAKAEWLVGVEVDCALSDGVDKESLVLLLGQSKPTATRLREAHFARRDQRISLSLSMTTVEGVESEEKVAERSRSDWKEGRAKGESEKNVSWYCKSIG